MNLFDWTKRIVIVFFAFGVYVGCSDVEFKAGPGNSETCENFSGTCVVGPDGFYLYSDSVKAGEVDILFVIDNSGSMYSEQKNMADRFPHFLDGISELDFQIAMTTTDISDEESSTPSKNVPSAANGNGALQDGKFIPFPNGSTIISNSTTDVENQFINTVKRPETLGCDNSGYSVCPSGDERAIYAANLVLDKADSNFFRQGAHFALVILSDEDERSMTYDGGIPGYPQEPYDLPETLVSKLGQTLGPSKTMSVHSVIIKPGDSTCWSAQNSQSSVKGRYGFKYAELSNAGSELTDKGNLVKGQLGSICASDYGKQLGDIGSKISSNTNLIQLACAPVDEEGQPSIEVSFDPAPSFPIEFEIDASNRLVLDPPAPAGVTVNFSYKCYRY